MSRRQYRSFRLSVSVPSGARALADAVKGPVPAPFMRAIAACGAARCARNGPNGARRSKRMVRGSTAWTLWITDGSSKSIRYADARVVRPRSKLAMTDDTSSGSPSWKKTPSRSVNVHDAPSFVICHEEASAGVIREVAGSTSTSVSKIWRVAMSDAASAFHGSNAVISAGSATRSVPPCCAPVGAGVVLVPDGTWQATPKRMASARTDARRTTPSAS